MLKLENVKKLYSNNRGLRNTTIDFQEGEITGILGRNGSGKTTLLKGILNLLPLDDGIITWNDKSVEEQFDKVAFITEDGSYFPYMSSKEGAVTDKSQPRHKKYTQFYREEGVFFGIIYV